MPTPNLFSQFLEKTDVYHSRYGSVAPLELGLSLQSKPKGLLEVRLDGGKNEGLGFLAARVAN